jgi:hypothetical protein
LALLVEGALPYISVMKRRQTALELLTSNEPQKGDHHEHRTLAEQMAQVSSDRE